MDFDFSPEQEMLRATVRAFLADKAPISYVRNADADDATVRRGLADLDVFDLTMVDAAVVLEELGRAVCPAPYMSSAVGAIPLLRELGDDALLSDLVDGLRIATVAVFEPEQRYQWSGPKMRAEAGPNDTWRLRGGKVHVLDGGVADDVLFTATDVEGALGLFVASEGYKEKREETVEVTRSFAMIECDDTPARRIGGGDVLPAIARTLDRLGVAAAVDGVGAAQRALELSVEYAKERVQFGKPIGAFQAVQHLCADMLRTVELGRAAAYYACWAIDEAPAEEAHRAATLVRAFAAEAFPQLGATAIQVFGGLGFTWEHDIHLFYKRLLTCSLAYGTASDHLAELAHLAIDESHDAV
jgi:alkylation response protein AidB-like acyl-CoA dehydrogenase